MFKFSAAQRLLTTTLLLGLISLGCSKVNSKLEEVTTAPDSPEALLVGTWQMPLEELGQIEGVLNEEQRATNNPQFTMVFTDEGKVTSSMDNRADDFVVQGQLVVVNGNAMSFEVNETELTLVGGGQTLRLTRVPDDQVSDSNQ